MPYALKVTEDNVVWVIDEAMIMFKFDLSHLHDEIEFNTEDGVETYLIVDGSSAKNNITFTTLTDAGFRQSWRFAEAEEENLWTRITRV